MNKNFKKGFTLAEVLIALAVIGVVSAIALPALMQSVTDKEWDAKRKALHARMANAIGQIDDFKSGGTYTTDTSGNVTADTLAESFLISKLSKVYKIKNICDSNHMTKCGMPGSVTALDGRGRTMPKDTRELYGHWSGKKVKAAAFETVNGDKMAFYYNPDCRPAYASETTRTHVTTFCMGFVYDLNGVSGPNQYGKDVGIIGVIYGEDPRPKVVAPVVAYYPGEFPFYSEEEGKSADAVCKAKDEKYTLPSMYEATAARVLSTFISYNVLCGAQTVLSSTQTSLGKSGNVWAAGHADTRRATKTGANTVFCIKE